MGSQSSTLSLESTTKNYCIKATWVIVCHHLPMVEEVIKAIVPVVTIRGKQRGGRGYHSSSGFSSGGYYDTGYSGGGGGGYSGGCDSGGGGYSGGGDSGGCSGSGGDGGGGCGGGD